MPIKNNTKQLFNGLIIVVGAAFLLYSLMDSDANIWFQIVGLVFMMFGAYRASSHWTAHKDDHLSEEEE